ncbi:protein THEMIS [Engraulis encrasicolus]|uniref:protein THEMIS n=1 Tax=Engraulis encrasicolus TaxID=184585 RepID=UPI002FCFF964
MAMMTLEEFTRSVEAGSLPRILQIQSGIYVQGSVYEMYGRECCLANGDLIKVIDIRTTRFIAEGNGGLKVDLPLNYPVRKDVVLIPPSLDVEVLDVTEQQDFRFFQQPLSLKDVFLKPEHTFPVVAEVIERPSSSSSSSSSSAHHHVLLPEELSFLCHSKRLVIHRALMARRVLVSETCRGRPQRRFLVPPSYRGRFKRRPREFPTAYDLQMARSCSEELHVVATRASEAHYLPNNNNASTHAATVATTVQAGEQFIIKRKPPAAASIHGNGHDKTGNNSSSADGSSCGSGHSSGGGGGGNGAASNSNSSISDGCAIEEDRENGLGKMADVLMCVRLQGKSQEAVQLPLYLEGHFIEMLHDNRQYTVADICRCFPLPFNVKVSVRDLSAKEDVLAAASGLQVEEEISEPYLQVSALDAPHLSWEVPANRLLGNVTVQLQEKWQQDEGVTMATAALGALGTRVDVDDSMNAETALAAAAGGVTLHAVVEEIGEDCYYTLRRYAAACSLQPPPRPPKTFRRHSDAAAATATAATTTRSLRVKPPRPNKPGSRATSPKTPVPDHSGSSKPDLAVRSESFSMQKRKTIAGTSQRPSLPPFTLPRTIKVAAVTKVDIPEDTVMDDTVDDDDPHDYEYIDEEELEFIRRKFHEDAVIRKTVKGKPSTF